MKKVIVTCAVVGENQYNQAHLNFPLTRQQIVDAALDAEQVGASCVHLHVQDPETGEGSHDPDPENRAGQDSDVASTEERMKHIETSLPDVCSLDMYTQNQLEGDRASAYLNTEYTLRKMARRFQELGVKLEMEVFALGDILLANKMLEEGLFDVPLCTKL